MTRTAYLQRLVDTLRQHKHGDLEISFKPFRGWYLKGEARSFTDDGSDYAGRNWREAERFVKWFLA